MLQPRRRSKHSAGAASGGTSRTGSPVPSPAIRYTHRFGPWSTSTRGTGRRSATPPRNTLSSTFDVAVGTLIMPPLSQVDASPNAGPAEQPQGELHTLGIQLVRQPARRRGQWNALQG